MITCIGISTRLDTTWLEVISSCFLGIIVFNRASAESIGFITVWVPFCSTCIITKAWTTLIIISDCFRTNSWCYLRISISLKLNRVIKVTCFGLIKWPSSAGAFISTKGSTFFRSLVCSLRKSIIVFIVRTISINLLDVNIRTTMSVFKCWFR